MAKKELSYSDALAELELIQKRLQSNDCSIDELKGMVKRSSELISLCRKRLYETDEEIKKILTSIETN
ncbi:hypothetical protein MASR1M31_08290 [Porphyromonadaceae bacterium]